MDPVRQEAASEEGNTSVSPPEARISVNDNAVKSSVILREGATEKREAPGNEVDNKTPAIESKCVSLPVGDGKEEASDGKTDVKKGNATAVGNSFQQQAGKGVKRGKERSKKEKGWDKDTQVKLICAEGTAIFVDREVAAECDLFRRMLATSEQGKPGFREGRKAEINLPTIRRRILEKTIEYLQFRHNWYRDGGHSGMFQVESDIALELLFAANYLGLSDGDAQTNSTIDLC